MAKTRDDDQFVVTFTRGGEYNVATPASFCEEDWAILDRVITAVREAITGAVAGHA